MFKIITSVLFLSIIIVFQAGASANVPIKNKFTYSEKIFLKRYNKYIDLIYEASNKSGIPMEELAAFIKIESGFKSNAYNKKYGASGLLQHIPSTWSQYKKAYGKKAGVSKNASVFNPKASLFIGAISLADERKKLAKATHRSLDQIKSGDLYLSHLYGFNKAVKLLNAPLNDKINKYVKINNSSGLTYHKGKRIMTMGEFRDGVNAKLEKEKSLYFNQTRDYQLTKFIKKLNTTFNKKILLTSSL